MTDFYVGIYKVFSLCIMKHFGSVVVIKAFYTLVSLDQTA